MLCALLTVLLAAPPAARLPAPAGSYAPSRAQGSGPGASDLSDVETCATCHPDVAAQWRQSAHAFASFNNPIYRLTVDRLRRAVGKDASRFCAGCHDVALLFDGAMGEEVRADDPRAHAGVTCRTCHGIEETTPDGNGSYRLAAAEIPTPTAGDPSSVARHRAGAALKPLRTAALCGSCHRAFLDADTGNRTHLPGMDDFTAWSSSVYAGSRAERVDLDATEADCRGCHMPREAAPLADASRRNGTVASHRFLGGHTWLYAMEKDPELLGQGQAFLRGSVGLDFGAAVQDDGARWLPADGAPLNPGHSLTLDVVVKNRRVGHRFPGGTLDAQDSWLEVGVEDANGQPLASSGTQGVHRFRALALDDRGQPLLERQTHLFRTLAFNQTLGPREATVVSFQLQTDDALAKSARLPFRAVARLMHRSRNTELQAAACAESRTARGLAFASAWARWGGEPVDVCTAQPVTEIARAEVWLGAGAAGHPSSSTLPVWQRLEEHGQGMSRALQERLDEARPSLVGALARLDTGSQPAERASVLCTLAQVAGRQGRSAEAVALLDQALRFLPEHPALLRARGQALANVWRWNEAVEPLSRAALLTPSDPGGWQELSLAAASAGNEQQALAAAQRGLTLQPRHPDLLRLQALSLAALGAGPDASAQALEAYLSHRSADEGPALRAQCSRSVAGCALERQPVHTHVLSPAR